MPSAPWGPLGAGHSPRRDPLSTGFPRVAWQGTGRSGVDCLLGRQFMCGAFFRKRRPGSRVGGTRCQAPSPKGMFLSQWSRAQCCHGSGLEWSVLFLGDTRFFCPRSGGYAGARLVVTLRLYFFPPHCKFLFACGAAGARSDVCCGRRRLRFSEFCESALARQPKQV